MRLAPWEFNQHNENKHCTCTRCEETRDFAGMGPREGATAEIRGTLSRYKEGKWVPVDPEEIDPVAPPVEYMTPRGHKCLMPDTSGWHHPRQIIWDEALWEEQVHVPTGWISLGYCPGPTTRLGWFLYHWRHGRLMGYPRLACLVFAYRHGLKKEVPC